MSQHDDEAKSPDIQVQVGDDIEGELHVAGRDVVIHKTHHINIPFPQSTAGRAVLGVMILVLLGIIALGMELPQKLGLIKAFSPAREGEVLLIVVDFTGDASGATADRIFDTLVRRLEGMNLDHVRIERLEGEAPSNLREVEAIGEEYKASIVIWGRVDELGFEPHYEVMEAGITYTVADLGMVTRDMPTFVAHVVEETPEMYEYLTLFSLGQLAFFSEDYDQAASLFDEALEIPLGNRSAELGQATLYLYRGASQLFAGDHNAAMSNVMQGALADRSFVLLALGLGTIQPVEQISMQINETPQDVNLYVQRALSYYVAGDYDPGLRDADHALELDPDLSAAHQARGLIVEAIENAAAALPDFDAAVESDPMNASAYFSRGFSYLAMNRLEEALADHNRALELNPNLVTLYLTRGITYALMGHNEAAIEDYEEYLSKWPDNPFAGVLKLGIIKLEEDLETP